MIHCEYCDYYKEMGGNLHKETDAKAFCSFVGDMLDTGMERATAGYPCKSMAYKTYQDRERMPVSVSKLNAEYWKFLYRSRQPIDKTSRLRSAFTS